MSQISGVVDSHNSRAAGTGTVHSVKVGGVWYGGMWSDPGINDGDNVTFEAVQSGQYWNVSKEGITVTAAAPPAPVSPTTGVPVNTRDVSIQYQSCRKDAIALLPTLFNEECITWPTKATKGDKYDFIMNLVHEMTAYNYIRLQQTIEHGGVSEEDFIPAPGS